MLSTTTQQEFIAELEATIQKTNAYQHANGNVSYDHGAGAGAGVVGNHLRKVCAMNCAQWETHKANLLDRSKRFAPTAKKLAQELCAKMA